MATQEHFDLAAFRAFVESKPADQEYDFKDPEGCAFGQFQRATGICDGELLTECDLNRRFNGLGDILNAGRGYTFGALADRLEALATIPQETTR